MEYLEGDRLPEECQEPLEKLRAYILDLATEEACKIIEEIERML